MGVSTLLRDQFVALQTVLVVLRRKSVKFMLSHRREFTIRASLYPSEFTALALAIKKFMASILRPFHCLFFKMHVLQTPEYRE